MTTQCQILVLDDDDVVLRVLALILSRGGYRCVPARTVEVAEAALTREAGAFDLLIADVGALPQNAGSDLLSRWRESAPRMRVLLSSGGRGESMTLPGYPFLGKPFGARELLRAVREVLTGSACHHESARTPAE